MPTREYRFRVAKPGETDLSQSTNVDLEFSTTDQTIRLADFSEWGGQRVTGVEAKAESLPWEIGIIESSTGEEVSGSLNQSTVAGPDMMRRTARLDVKRGSTGSFSPDGGGRVSDLSVDRESQMYRFTVRDDLFKARTAGAFSSNDTRIFPPGPDSDFWEIKAPDVIEWEIVAESTSNQHVDLVPFRRQWRLIPNVVPEIIDDVVGSPQPGQGNFRNFVFETGGGLEAGVEEFVGSVPGSPAQALEARSERADQGEYVSVPPIRVRSSALNTSGNTVRGFLQAFGRDPSSALPLHFGGATGIDPMQFTKDRYDDAGVRTPSTLYQTHSSTAPNALLDHPLKLDDLFVRVTEPTTSLQAYLERTVFDTHGVAPLTDDQGRVEPTYMRQPDADDIPATTDLHTFTSTNIDGRHPTWQQQTREQVTAVNFRADRFGSFLSDPPGSADKIRVTEQRDQATFGTSVFGEHQRTVRLHGFNNPLFGTARIAHDTFQRFGNGPIKAQWQGMSDASTVRAGDFVVLDLDTMPKAPDATRGGRQIFQILSRTGTVKGSRFDALELGPEAQSLSAPSLSMTQSPTDPKHAVNVSVSGLTTGGSAQVRLAARDSEPSASSEWTLLDLVLESSTETETRSQLPSDETIWGQARQDRDGRITSAWSTSVSVDTQAITAPSGLSISSTDANEARFTWSNGSTRYNTRITLSSTVHVRRVTAIAGSDQQTVSGFQEDHSPGDSIDVAVAHIDRFGGVSGATTGTLTLSTEAATSPSVQRLTVSQGFAPTESST